MGTILVKGLSDTKGLEKTLRECGVDLKFYYNWVRKSGIEKADFLAAAIVGKWKVLPATYPTTYCDFRMPVAWSFLDHIGITDSEQREQLWHAARYIEDCSKGQISLHIDFLAI